MYVLAKHLVKQPVISLQLGETVATTNGLVVNGPDLRVMAVSCKAGRWGRSQAVILLRDIRQIARDCLLIDSFEDIEDLSEIIRLQAIADRQDTIFGKMVMTQSGQRLGSVDDFSIDPHNGLLHKLYVNQSLMKSLTFNSLVIERSQIANYTSKAIVVRDAYVTKPQLTPSQPPAPA